MDSPSQNKSHHHSNHPSQFGKGGTKVSQSSDQKALTQAINKASILYHTAPPQFRWYAWFKYRLDPCYFSVASQIPPNSLTVDLGTGLGMLPVVLALLGESRQVLGIEWDEKKAKVAQQVSGALDGVCIQEGNALTCDIPSCDVITLVDMLHYYSPAIQDALLARCVHALNPGGRLLVREADRTRSGFARWTRWVEGQSTRLGWNKGPSVFFRAPASLHECLTSLGCDVHFEPVAGPLHPGNILIIAQKK